MTDSEIIKAWEKILATGDAPIGEYWGCGGVVTTKLAKETFDMLNRQKAEIEQWKEVNILIAGQRDERIAELEAEIEMLSIENYRLKTTPLNDFIDPAKFEAIKEFEKRLKAKALTVRGRRFGVVDYYDIEIIAKELTEE